jgi:hypothetical protein
MMDLNYKQAKHKKASTLSSRDNKNLTNFDIPPKNNLPGDG